ncbi:uncharacterized protein LOC116432779 isoform X2 [Nomia melanderi]|uniref:uncharacterized protein LOC116432779 isoform X2 n=1 Tax=Nomia melanderi TaxID=2448451 RepID=UPI0013044E01|nr:uncharacterized protein LOC116432779 isoform X2 [Nomia melanderi]XP_031845994.1 uncharacterized protein LOC116432779 isoform X2 [Nomia melanderi]
MSTKTFSRRIPNILKNNLKPQKVTEVTLDETSKICNNVKENVQNSFNQITVLSNSSSEKKCIKKGNKYRRSSSRRKQEHSFTDVWQESLSWNMYSFMDDKGNSKACIKRKKSRYFSKKQSKKCEVPTTKIEKPKENLLPAISHDISTELTSEFHDGSFLEETEAVDLQNPIDFSSNEIFSNFNYKFQDANEITSFTEYTMDSDEIFNSFGTMCDSRICEKEYDINDNEIDTHKSQYVTSTECWDKDTQLVDEKEPSCSTDCCSYCLEDCASHWIATSKLKHMMSLKNKFLSESSVTTENDINYQVNTGYSTVDTLEEDFDENSTCWLITCTPETSSSCELQDTESSCIDTNNCYNQQDIKKETLEDLTTIERKEYNASTDDSNNSPIKSSMDAVFYESDENIKVKYQEDTLQDQEYSEKDTIDERFQCVLCPLMFSSARTLAVHQAAAHGDTSFIAAD